jgi:hypothetical protein
VIHRIRVLPSKVAPIVGSVKENSAPATVRRILGVMPPA